MCKVRGCQRDTHARGWCRAHYLRVLRSGDPGSARIRPRGRDHRVERFWSKVAKRKSDECWIWQARRNKYGYGIFIEYQPYRERRAHQVAFELEHGWYPVRGSGQELRHLCGNRACVNVAHIVPGTSQENAADRRRHGRGGVLSFEQAQEIRERLTAGAVARRLAEEYGVAESTISRIKNGTAHKP